MINGQKYFLKRKPKKILGSNRFFNHEGYISITGRSAIQEKNERKPSIIDWNKCPILRLKLDFNRFISALPLREKFIPAPDGKESI
jgi:hypothetical protein